MAQKAPASPASASAPDGAGHRARLRQRLFDGGDEALLDHELVEYLLALAIPRRDTKTQAKALLQQFGGIGRLLDTPHEALRREGLSDGVIAALKIAQATARRLLETRIEDRPILSSWDALGDYLTATMAHLAIEQVRVLFLKKQSTPRGKRRYANNILIASVRFLPKADTLLLPFIRLPLAAYRPSGLGDKVAIAAASLAHLRFELSYAR